jgi:ribosomal protein S15P/S13E
MFGNISPGIKTNSAVLTGVSFDYNRPGGALIVSTDKNIISLPLDVDNLIGTTATTHTHGKHHEKKAANRLNVGWSIKKLDFGSARLVKRDHLTGLLCLSFQFPQLQSAAAPTHLKSKISSAENNSPTTTTTTTATITEGLALVHSSHCLSRLASHESKHTVYVSLKLSSPQIYLDNNIIMQSNAINDLCLVTPCNRLITVDTAGLVAIWYMDERKLDAFTNTSLATRNTQLSPLFDTHNNSNSNSGSLNNQINNLLEKIESIDLSLSNNDKNNNNNNNQNPESEFKNKEELLSERPLKNIPDHDVKKNNTFNPTEDFNVNFQNSLDVDIDVTSNIKLERPVGLLKVDERRVAILDIIEHNRENNSESETTDNTMADIISESNFTDVSYSVLKKDIIEFDDSSILPYPHAYAYTYERIVSETRVIEMKEIEKQRVKTMKHVLQVEGSFPDKGSEDEKDEEESVAEEDLIYVGDEEVIYNEAATKAAKEAALAKSADVDGAAADNDNDISGAVEEDDDGEVIDPELIKNTASNSAAPTRGSVSIPIEGLESWVNVFKEAEEEALVEQKNRLQAMLDEQPEETGQVSNLIYVNTVTFMLQIISFYFIKK